MTKARRLNRRSGPKVNTGLELRQFGPITDNQVKAFNYYQSDNNLVLYGCAGTGKTFIALYLALYEILNKESHIRKIVLIRTPQATKQIGHLPGTEKQKMEAYESPYRAICSELFGRDDAYDILKQKGIIEFHGTMFLRGTSIPNAIILVDEIQNQSYHEIRTVVTRTGEHSKVVICGDTKQDDLTSKRYNEESGFRQAMKVFEKIPTIKNVEFDVDDIVRSGFVRDFIIAENELGFY